MHAHKTVLLALCIVAAGSTADEPKIDNLVKKLGMMGSSNAEVRATAAEDIGKLGEAGKPYARALCTAAFDKSPKVRAKASEALLAVHPKLHPHVKKLLTGSDSVLDPETTVDRAKARDAIAAMETDGVGAYPVIAAQLKANVVAIAAEKPRIGVKAGLKVEEAMAVADIGIILKIAPGDAEAIKLLATYAATETRPAIRVAAIRALETTGQDHPDTQKLFLQTLKNLATQKNGASDVTNAALNAVRRLENPKM